jgi:hypothetical protein
MKPIKLTAIILLSAIILSGVVVIFALTGRDNKPISKSPLSVRTKPVAQKPFQMVKPPKITYKSNITPLKSEPSDPNTNSGLSKAMMDKRQRMLPKEFLAKSTIKQNESSTENLPYDLYMPAPAYVPFFEQRQQLTMSEEFQRHTQRYQILKDRQRLEASKPQQEQMKKEMFSRVSARYQGYFNNMEQMKKDKLAKSKQSPPRVIQSASTPPVEKSK